MAGAQAAAATPEAKEAGARPVLSSASDEGGLTLWVNDAPTKDNSPDLTGYIKDGENQIRVSAWLVPPGKGKDDKEHGAFASLAKSWKEGDEWKSESIGTINAMNTYKGEPVTSEHRSRVIGDVKLGDRKITVVGFATEEMLAYDGLSKALGFTGDVVTKTPEAKRSPKPA